MPKFKVRDHVMVPFGFEELEGTIIRVSDDGPTVRVMVSVDIEGADEPFVTTYDADEVSTIAVA